MTEKGKRPKAFTKEWFGYIWDYYKAHILVGALVTVFAVVLVIEMANRIENDAHINYIATNTIPLELADELAHRCSLNSDDLNGNGRVDIAINQLNFTVENRQNSEMHQALLNKMMVLFNSNDELLFVVDSQMLPQTTQNKYAADIFYKSKEWYKENSYDNEYAVPLNNSAIFEELGIDSSDLFVLVAKADNEEGYTPEENNAIKIAKFLLK